MTYSSHELYHLETGIKYMAMFVVTRASESVDRTISLSIYRKCHDDAGWYHIRGFDRPYLLSPSGGALLRWMNKAEAVAQWDLLRKNGWTKEEQ